MPTATSRQPQAIAAFLGKVPDARLMVLDIGNDRYPGTWKASQAFDNKQWIYGYVHNYGASNPLYGDFAFYRQDLQALLADPDKRNLRGFGVFPEGLHSNSVVYEYLYALAWEGPQQSWSQWLTQYTRARYGRSDAALLQAWSDLEAGIYQTRYWSPRWWNKRAGAYLLFKRPTADIVGFDDRPGDPQRLRRAIDALLQQADRYADAPLYRYDLIEDARHYLSLHADRQLQAVVQAYGAGDFARGDALLARTTRLVQGLDALVGGQHETLADWTGQAAAAAGDDAALRRVYVGNARAQVSVWGGDGNLADYASKAWQGMYAEFYLQRWTRFLSAYRAARKSGHAVRRSGLQHKACSVGAPMGEAGQRAEASATTRPTDLAAYIAGTGGCARRCAECSARRVARRGARNCARRHARHHARNCARRRPMSGSVLRFVCMHDRCSGDAITQAIGIKRPPRTHLQYRSKELQ
ncbi:alpha-N-acetylglucosaminidase [Xanthomonas hortorum pv. pelargonii]|nr:alpha-N-acetylglucosaminidase [Xanthomonas hortorum pv. pelargonii]